ncbi:hypothetical protein GCM10009555_041510 [Acrocarpospora macrocephala]|uniref:Uncharacterized protein n=2 Tax=Acrocarpospora TaxID=90974 RepID=A0A5M3XK42_9ACTN|nr:MULTISPECIES: hypothetical protein [Acrocarpospora]GES09878.1 hypothetical protein Amac_034740 [Acrocarpospora macrocephala]GES21775.1 hypothetical protein Aple_046710 [Acrocarpospora pleiomorpha]
MANRIGIGIVGTLLLLTGLYALWARDAHPDLAILDPGFFAAHIWAYIIAAAVLPAAAAIATRWLIFALALHRYGTRHGTGTAMLGVALQGLDRVDKLTVRVVRGERTRIHVRCRPGASLGEVARRLDQQAITRVRGVLGPSADLPVLVRLHVTRL